MEKIELIVLLDSVSRTIAGVKVSENDETITVKNPVIVSAMPNQQGQMSLQLIPVFFREILEDKNQDCVFDYAKNAITTTNITSLESAIVVQYNALFQTFANVVDAEAGSEDKVVDLFEEKVDG